MKLIQTLRGECRSINIAICEDDIGFAESLRGKIEKRMRTEPENTVTYVLRDGESLIKGVDERDFDLIFMDVEMPGMSGFDTAKAVIGRKTEPEVIFISGHSQYVFESFKFRPFDFIIKEMMDDRLGEILDRYLNEYRSRWKVITVWQENDKERKQEYLFLSEVVYIESQGHKLLVRTLAEQDSYIRFPMNEAEEALGRYGFIRIHHGYLVNGERISRFKKEECIMQDGSRIPVSRGRRERALEAYKQLKRR